MHGAKTVSVVFPAYNEEQYIRPAIEDFLIADVVDEVLVVDNNSRDRTAEEAGMTRARVVKEMRQGYGFALRRGLPIASLDKMALGNRLRDIGRMEGASVARAGQSRKVS